MQDPSLLDRDKRRPMICNPSKCSVDTWNMTKKIPHSILSRGAHRMTEEPHQLRKYSGAIGGSRFHSHKLPFKTESVSIGIALRLLGAVRCWIRQPESPQLSRPLCEDQKEAADERRL